MAALLGAFWDTSRLGRVIRTCHAPRADIEEVASSCRASAALLAPSFDGVHVRCLISVILEVNVASSLSRDLAKLLLVQRRSRCWSRASGGCLGPALAAPQLAMGLWHMRGFLLGQASSRSEALRPPRCAGRVPRMGLAAPAATCIGDGSGGLFFQGSQAGGRTSGHIAAGYVFGRPHLGSTNLDMQGEHHEPCSLLNTSQHRLRAQLRAHCHPEGQQADLENWASTSRASQVPQGAPPIAHVSPWRARPATL